MPKRIQLSRKKGFKLPPNTVVVSRPFRHGNPFKVGADVPGLAGVKMDQQDAVDYFAIFPPFPAETIVAELRGKNLACWCKPGTPCHADILLKTANANRTNDKAIP